MTKIYVEKGPSRNLRDGRSLYVYTETNDLIFNSKIRTLPIRYYIPETKQWELPIGSMSLLRKLFQNIVIRVDQELGGKKFSSMDEYYEYLRTLSLPPGLNFEPKTKMDPHQVEFFLEMLNRNRVILGDPMGLGKTKEYLDVCEYRRATAGYNKILFICKSKHKENMAKEIRRHSCKKCPSLNLRNCDRCKNCPIYIIVDGSEEHRIQLLRNYYHLDEVAYLILSFEMAAHHSHHLKSLARHMGFDAIIVDEFTKIKNWGSHRRRKDNKAHITIQITKLIEVINPDLLIMGSGTPMTKDPTDLYAPLRLMGVERRSHEQFKRYFCRTDRYGRILGYQNIDELRELLSSVMIRRPKELLKLPDKRINYIPLIMTTEQRQLYEAARRAIKEELRGTKVYGASKLALLTRLRQITTDPRLVDKDITGVKERVLIDLIEEIVEGGEKAVIYSIYRQYTQRLKDLLRDYNPCYIDGTLSSKKAQEQVDLFQSDQERLILIGSLQATNESYTLTAATQAIFVDMSWTVTDNQQAEDRLHRRGQTNSVSINYLYCKDTIDERVLDILERDASLIYEVVTESERTVSKEIFEHLIS